MGDTGQEERGSGESQESDGGRTREAQLSPFLPRDFIQNASDKEHGHGHFHTGKTQRGHVAHPRA
ncbi:MAG: hypothetical protein RI957_1540 [Verrucomicrobiota bacterium]